MQGDNPLKPSVCIALQLLLSGMASFSSAAEFDKPPELAGVLEVKVLAPTSEEVLCDVFALWRGYQRTEVAERKDYLREHEWLLTQILQRLGGKPIRFHVKTEKDGDYTGPILPKPARLAQLKKTIQKWLPDADAAEFQGVVRHPQTGEEVKVQADITLDVEHPYLLDPMTWQVFKKRLEEDHIKEHPHLSPLTKISTYSEWKTFVDQQRALDMDQGLRSEKDMLYEELPKYSEELRYLANWFRKALTEVPSAPVAGNISITIGDIFSPRIEPDVDVRLDNRQMVKKSDDTHPDEQAVYLMPVLIHSWVSEAAFGSRLNSNDGLEVVETGSNRIGWQIGAMMMFPIHELQKKELTQEIDGSDSALSWGLGATLENEEIGILLGLSYRISGLVLHGGISVQQIDKLSGGLSEGDEILSDAEIQTNQEFKAGFYLGVGWKF